MSTAIMFARLLLAAIFAVAGLAKLLDQKGFRTAVREFGIPQWLVAPIAVVVPLVELGVAAALVPAKSTFWAAIGALILLGVFTTAILISLSQGKRPDCRCFGQVHSAPVGITTVIRNLVLAGVAGVVAWQAATSGALGVSTWAATLTASHWLVSTGFLVLLAAVLVQSWLILNLVRQQGVLHLRLDALEAQLPGPRAPAPPPNGLAVGSPAPDFELPGLYGETLTLQALRADGRRVLLVFSDPHCGPCAQLMPQVARWQAVHRDTLTVAVITRGDVDSNRRKAAETGIRAVIRQQDNEVADRYSVHGTPSAVLVNADGTVASAIAAGPDAIAGLVSSATAVAERKAPSRHPGIGEIAPEFELPAVDGKQISIREFHGKNVLLLFWSPNCGFCARMLDDLRAWEATGLNTAPQLVVISTGTVAESRAMSLISPVLSDPDNSVAPKFGVTGTPMAIRLDVAGRIDSHLAAGAEAVFDLARNLPLASAAQNRAATRPS